MLSKRRSAMIKTGIYTTEQLLNRASFKTLVGADKPISITLYDKINNMPCSEELAERILLLFSDERGAYKRTYAKRFESFDTIILEQMKKHFGSETPLVIEDVAVSDARTSVDLFEKLEASFPKVSYHASDYNPKVYIIEKGRMKVTLSQNNRILEVVWPPFVFNMIVHTSWHYYMINQLCRLFIARFLVKPLVNEYFSGKIKAREILLFCPPALSLSKKDDRFQLYQHDLLARFEREGNINIIRAMNILNPSYFLGGEMKKVVQNIHRALNNDGWLITGSNQDSGSTLHGGIYQKTLQGFKKIYQSGEGSPVEEVILGTL